MKYLAFATLLFSFFTQACQWRGEPDKTDPFLDAMKSNEILVIATVERIYHRKDRCSNENHCSDSGLVIKVLEVLKGEASTYIEAYQGMYTSCYGGIFHPIRKLKQDTNGVAFEPSYSIGNDYLMVLKEQEDDFVVVAGKELGLSLMLLKKYRAENTANKQINQDK
jgi:hypothetical protein